MFKISVEEVKKLKERIAQINHLEFKDIIWTKDGKDLAVPPEMVKEFNFTGLSNCDFVWYYDEIEK